MYLLYLLVVFGYGQPLGSLPFVDWCSLLE